MLLSALFKNPIRTFIHLERYSNFEDFYKPELLGDINPQYSPLHGVKNMNLPFFYVPLEEVKFYPVSSLESGIFKKFVGDGHIKFPVHPQLIQEPKSQVICSLVSKTSRIEWADAEPTASIRTLLVKESQPYFAKLHFPGRISSSQRSISNADIVRGHWLTSEFERLSRAGQMPKTIGYYPELMGMVYEDGDSIGAILRSFNPSPNVESTINIPFFSIFGQDQKIKDDEPLVVQLARAHNKKLDEYTLEQIIEPHLKNWAWFNFKAGIRIEAHSQNMTLEIDSNYNISRINYKDFQGRRFIIPSFREANGHYSDPLLLTDPQNICTSADLGLSYDFLVGFLLYEKILNFLDNQGYDRKKVRSKIKELFHLHVPDAERYMPKTMIYIKGFGSERKIVDTGEKPRYR